MYEEFLSTLNAFTFLKLCCDKWHLHARESGTIKHMKADVLKWI